MIKDRITITWTIDDVEAVAEQLEVELTVMQVVRILTRMETKFNPSIGLNWDVIETYVREEVGI